jgi:glutamyl-tRNA synthetase
MNEETKKIVTRFAPSPTGFQHVGGIRTALYAWAWAKKNNGTFILRIEDTDRERFVEGSQEHLAESLKWFGIEWDEGPDIGGPHAPYLQSERLEIYKKYAHILTEKGYAYSDPYSEEDVAVFRKKAEEEKRAFLYRDHRPETFDIWDGTKPLRFKVPEIKSYTWNDAVRGELTAGEEALDDFILIKSDGYPTYNFAHIIDDLEMGVTHIMRSDEFISSTPKFLSLYDALGIVPPVFVTLPPILGKEGTKKLGKRDGAKDVLDYRKEGYLPEAMLNFLVFLGWNPGTEQEIFTKDQFIESFNINRIHKSGAMFNEDKLTWINKEHMKLMDEEDLKEKMLSFFPEKSFPTEKIKVRFQKMAITAKERAATLASYYEDFLAGEYDFLISEPGYANVSLVWKKSDAIKTKELLQLLEMKLLESFDLDAFKLRVEELAEKEGKGDVFWPLRVALSGKEKSPDPFTLLFVLGKEASLTRIRNAVNSI